MYWYEKCSDSVYFNFNFKCDLRFDNPDLFWFFLSAKSFLSLNPFFPLSLNLLLRKILSPGPIGSLNVEGMRPFLASLQLRNLLYALL